MQSRRNAGVKGYRGTLKAKGEDADASDRRGQPHIKAELPELLKTKKWQPC